ncbi:MAG: hypothetical protein HY035_01085 [Nitrospirae bacterium]|nr:hypothetical protein [Nitrospirota bacterium]MBI3376984.1 hypothetical protein [Nitrospirota bacterium]
MRFLKETFIIGQLMNTDMGNAENYIPFNSALKRLLSKCEGGDEYGK